MAKRKTGVEHQEHDENSLFELTIGCCYLFTDPSGMVYCGVLRKINGPHDVVLRNSAWISKSGSYLSNFIESGEANGMEVEPVGIRALHWIGWSPWTHEPFTERT